MIVYDWEYPRQPGVEGTGAYTNRDEAETEGAEFAFGWHITDTLILSGTYTYCESRSKKNSEQFRTPQIARNKANLDISYTHDRFSFNIHPYYSGPGLRWKGDIEMEEYIRIWQGDSASGKVSVFTAESKTYLMIKPKKAQDMSSRAFMPL
ncbi:TonB dependent receptor domain-containing protein [Desulfonema magnum]|uniref:TonB dependent receptor domain-containing protein n=1 Tax=Desulfonema magnum TaxID=45655 RepID=A0A975BK46_9BACT|nr:TonB dependent receptor domain-containing protein [Desulfonema magnum]